MQGTSVEAEPSGEFRPPRPAEPHPVPALAVPRSALFGGRLQWPDHQSSLSPQWSKATSHPPVALPLLLASLRQGAKKGLSFSPALTVLQNQCRGTWIGQCELAWLLLENYTYSVNKRKLSTQQLYISAKSMKGYNAKTTTWNDIVPCRSSTVTKEFEVVNNESIILAKMCFSSSGNSVAKCIKRIYSNPLL